VIIELLMLENIIDIFHLHYEISEDDFTNLEARDVDEHQKQQNIDVNILKKIKKMYNSLIDRYNTIFSTNNTTEDPDGNKYYETIMSNNYPDKNYRYKVHRYGNYEFNGSEEYDLKNDSLSIYCVLKDFINPR